MSASECVAVGSTYTGSATETLAEVWNGTVWSVVSSPNVGTSDDELLSVSCVSVSECVAVGYVDIGNYVLETLVMVWDGTEWSIMSSPNAGTSDDGLRSVSCVSVSECVAVGYTNTGSAYEALVMAWDGMVWSVVTSPNAGTGDDGLESVSCVSVSDCVAAGSIYTNRYETLVLSLTGPVPPSTTTTIVIPSTTTTTVPASTTTVVSDQVVPAFTG